MEPTLSLSYSSSAKSSLVGHGWSLSGTSQITRCGSSKATDGQARGVTFGSADKFCLDGQRLVGTSGTYGADGSEYRTEKDTFTKVVSQNAAGANGKFVAYTKAGRVLEYSAVSAGRYVNRVSKSDGGTWTNSQVLAGSPNVLWVLTSEKDRSGNGITYEYQNLVDADGLEIAPHRIRYTSHGSEAAHRYVEFQLEARPDKQSSWKSGVPFKQTRRIKTIAMYAPNPSTTAKVWQYDLTYAPSGRTGKSLLTSVKQCAAAGGCKYSKNFGWNVDSASSPFTVRNVGTVPSTVSGNERYLHVMDVNGDGLDDAVYGAFSVPGKTFLGARDEDGNPVPLSRQWSNAWGAEAAGNQARPVDLSGDGKDEIWIPIKDTGTGKWRAQLRQWNETTHAFAGTGMSGSVECRAEANSVDCGEDTWVDLDGDGRLDLVYVEPIPSSSYARLKVRRNENGTLAAPETSNQQISQADTLTYAGDVFGDGRSKIMVHQDGATPDGGYAIGQSADGEVMGRSSSPNGAGHAFFTTPKTTGDFNGDGLVDWVYTDPVSTVTSLFWNTGLGAKRSVVETASTVLGVLDPYIVGSGDMNQDGRDDILLRGYTRGSDSAVGPSVAYSNGDGTFAEPLPMTPQSSAYDDLLGGPTRVGDFNGDGRKDFLYITEGNQMVELEQAALVTDRLTRITDQGAPNPQYSVYYSSQWNSDDSYPIGDNHSCAYPLRCIRTGMVVAKQVDSPQGTQHYAFMDPVSDLRGRGFLGFGKMRILDPARPSETILTFNNETRVTMPFPLLGERYPYAFTPAKVTVATPIMNSPVGTSKPATATARVQETTYTREVRGGYNYTTPVTSSSTKTWEESVNIDWGNWPFQKISGIATPTNPPSVVTGTYDYDTYGNQTYAKNATTDGVTQETTTTWDNRTADWLIGLRTGTTETRKEADPAIPAVTRNVTYTNDTLGRPEKTEVEKNATDTSLQSTVTTRYNAYGLPSSTTTSAPGVPSRTAHTEYEAGYPGAPDEHIFASQIWSEHALEQYRPSAWTAVHPASGQPVAIMDVNGVQTTTTYDGFGRPLAVARPGQRTVTHAYSGRPVTGGTNGLVATTTQGGQISTEVTDSDGYRVSATSQGFNGQVSTVDVAYDSLHRASSVTNPYRGSTPAGVTRYTYDSLDRLVETVLPNASTVSTTHTGLFATTTDRAGNVVEETRDKNGRLITSVNDPAGKNVSTQYKWGPFDTLLKVTDDAANVTTMGYDTLGRRTSLADPDSGTTEATFYGTGDLRRETHTATGEFSEITYDDLGRGITRTTNTGANSFVWDTSAHGVGQIAATTSADGIRTQYTYDAEGRQTGMEYIDGTASYASDRTFDPTTGKIATASYPSAPGRDRFTLRYDYNTIGYLTKVTDVTPNQPNQPYWQTTARTANDALDTAIMGTGTSGIVLDNTYDPTTGQLTDIDNVRADGPGTKLTDLHYDYYPTGMVKRQYDAVSNRNEMYTYDKLNRLTDWTLGDAGTISYGYDNIGNMTTVKKNGTVTETHGFGKADGSQPHTLTSVTPAGQSARQATVDAKGRQTEGSGRQTTYTPFNLPKTVTKAGKTTTYSYDAFGSRVKESSPDGTTFTVPGLYEKRTAGSSTKHVFHVKGSDGLIGQAVFDGTSTTMQYHITDAIGSVKTTAIGQGQQQYFYDPFGARINADRAPYTGTTGDLTRGFTGHEHDDDLGTINMKGRIYDSADKTFLTPDPIVSSPGSSQSWNPYSYVKNSPLNNTDPSGFMFCVKITTNGEGGNITCYPEEGDPLNDPGTSMEHWLTSMGYGTGTGNGSGSGGGWGGNDGSPAAGGYSGSNGYKAPNGDCPGGCHTPNRSDLAPPDQINDPIGEILDEVTDMLVQEFADTVVGILCFGQCGTANAPTSSTTQTFNSPSDAQVLAGAVKAGIEVIGLPGPVENALDAIPGSDMVADDLVESAIDTITETLDPTSDYSFPEQSVEENVMERYSVPQNGPNDD
nr:FG-GAP-like repeat-containing protein [Streptomyces sp. CB02009]